MKKPMLLLTLCLSINYGFAQDQVYSLFHLSPLTLNPALAGIECGSQISANYRNQWRGFGNFRTMGLTYEMPFQLNSKSKIGVGFKTNYDVGGSFNFKTFDVGGTMGYHHDFSKKDDVTHLVSGGIEFGIRQKRIKFTGPIIAQDSREFQDYSARYFDMGLGINYRFQNSKVNWLDIGASIFHLNTPNESFDSGLQSDLPRRYVVYAKGSFLKQKRFRINPRILYTEMGPSSLLIPGIGFSYFLDKNRKHAVEIGYAEKQPLAKGSLTPSIISLGYYNQKMGITAVAERGDFLGNSYEGAVYYRFCK